MNFLAHYFFDRHQEDPYFNLGLLLPDLVRNFEPGAKLSLVRSSAMSNISNSMFDGCLQHVQSDKTFHAWSGFHQMMSEVTDISRRSAHNIDKDWFVAHILSELVMDHQLLLMHPNLAADLYADFESLEADHIRIFLERHKITNFEKFHFGFQRFMEVRYLEKYVELESIVYALGRICTKVKLPPFTEGQIETIKICTQVLMDRMPKRLMLLQKELD